MLLKDLVAGQKITYLQGDGEREILGLSIDSREVLPGMLFVCIRGAVYDGNHFVKEAVERGANAIITDSAVPCERETLLQACAESSPGAGVAVLLVENCRQTLAHLAGVWYKEPAKEMTLIGITGTKGKTTSTYMIRSILENAGRRVGLIGTNEIIIGRKHYPAENTTPESLRLHGLFRRMVEEGMDTVVMEVSSQAVKLHRTDGILFDYGIFTNLSPDHIAPAEHRDFQEYLDCKRQLFRQCKIGLVNGDDPYTEEVLKGHTCQVETFGLGENCTLRAKDIRYVREADRLGMEFQVAGDMEFGVRVPLPGLFSVYNALAAISLCRHFRVRETDIQRSMLAARVRGRIEPVPGPSEYSILIDYAHNPMALKSLLETLREYHPTRLVCVFGCGGNRPVLRRRKMGYVSGKLADLTILTNDNPREEDPLEIIEEIRRGVVEAGGAYRVIPDRSAAIAYAMYTARKGDIVILAGKGHEEYQEIKGVKYPMDERKIVQEILAE